VSTPREQLATILRQSRLGGGFDSHGSLAKRLHISRPVISRAEGPAQAVPCWGPLVVPGVIQSESYARAVLSVEPYTPERLAELVERKGPAPATTQTKSSWLPTLSTARESSSATSASLVLIEGGLLGRCGQGSL
jgi:Domain of unknown function (DUF5753)